MAREEGLAERVGTTLGFVLLLAGSCLIAFAMGGLFGFGVQGYKFVTGLFE